MPIKDKGTQIFHERIERVGVGKQNGQVTVFLSLILLAVVIVIGLLIDVSRVLTAQAQVKRAVSSSAGSILANYSSKLKDDYGIFALSSGGKPLEAVAEEYISKNLMIDKSGFDDNHGLVSYNILRNLSGKRDEAGTGRYFDLYDYRIENISVTPLFNLSENEVVRNQVLEYMKYRAPKQIAEGVWERFAAVKEASKMSYAYNRKLKIDRLAAKAGRAQERIKRCVDGALQDTGRIETCVNSFNDEGNRDRLVLNYANCFAEYGSLINERKDIDKSISSLKIRMGSDADSGSETAFKKELKELEDSKRRISDRIEEARKDMKNLIEQIRINQTVNFIKPNEDAVASLKEIVKLGKELRTMSFELINYLAGNFNGSEAGDMPRNFKNEMEGDIGKIEELIPDENEAETLINSLEQNIDCLKACLKKIDEVLEMVRLLEAGQAPSYSGLSDDCIISGLNYGLNTYSRIKYNYNLTEKSGKFDDPRESNTRKAQNSVKFTEKDDKNIGDAGISLEELPSRKKARSILPDAAFDDTTDDKVCKPLGGQDSSDGGSAGYSGDLGSLNREIEFKEETEGFADKAFCYIASMGDILANDLTALRDDIYIDEYIMGIFKNAVPALKRDIGEEPDRDFGGLEKKKRQSFFDCEVEYILHGRPSQNANVLMTKGEILLIRFALNTLHVYTDPEKKELAAAIATAVSGWWTAGLGVPIVSNLVMCSWGMGEAVLDLNHLMKGESVPFYKSKQDWELKIGLSDVKGKKSDKRLLFSYYDYLRLLLLLENSEDKINRIEDLVELNMKQSNSGFKAGSCNTYLRIESEVSIKYLFITRMFMPADMKTRDGRHRFRVVTYAGY